MKRFLCAALLALFVLPGISQTAFPPAGSPVFRAFDQNGVPLAGGLLYSYAAGTSTPLATYTDYTGATPNTNPVVLDATGSAKVFLGAANYKFVLQSALGVQQWTVDHIVGAVVGATSVTSFNGRNGVVLPGTGDYVCAQVTNCPSPNTFSAAFSVAGSAVDLGNVGTPGTYARPTSVTTDAYGRVTAITAGTTTTPPVDYYWSFQTCANMTGQPSQCTGSTTLPGAMPDANYQLFCQTNSGATEPSDQVLIFHVATPLPLTSGATLNYALIQIFQNGTSGGATVTAMCHAHHA